MQAHHCHFVSVCGLPCTDIKRREDVKLRTAAKNLQFVTDVIKKEAHEGSAPHKFRTVLKTRLANHVR
jgi:hypothetical protein